MNIIEVEKKLFEIQSKQVPQIKPGDVITVHEKIFDGKKARIQKFQGIVMCVKGSLFKQTVLIRKKFQNFWVEKSFFIHSPLVDQITIDQKGYARRAYLSYLRIPKNLSHKIKRLKK